MKQRKRRLIRACSRQGWLGCYRAKRCCVSGVGGSGKAGAPHSHLSLPAPSLTGFPPAWQPTPTKPSPAHPGYPSVERVMLCPWLGHGTRGRGQLSDLASGAELSACVSLREEMGRRAATTCCSILTPYYPIAHL